MLRGRITRLKGVPVGEIAVPAEFAWVLQGDRGITWAAEPPPGDPARRGRVVAAGPSGPLLVSFDAEIAAGFGLRLGDTVTVNVLGRELTAEIASLREVDWGQLGINFVMVFSPGRLQSAPQMALATVHVPPGEEDRARAGRRASAFANISAIRVAEALRPWAASSPGWARPCGRWPASPSRPGFWSSAGVAAALRRRRIYEAVVLKVLGATRGRLLKALLAEHLLVGLATAPSRPPRGGRRIRRTPLARWSCRSGFSPAPVLLTAC